MSDFPVFSPRGTTDSAKLEELISYLPSLSSAIEREMMSLDFSNLNANLRSRIESGITEHQDLSGFASKNYAKNHFYEKEVVDGIKKELEADVRGVISDMTTLSSYVSALSSKVSVLEESVKKLEKG